MNFVEKLLGLMSSGFDFVGDMLFSLISFIAKPLSYVFYFFDGVFYFLYQLYNIVVGVIKIFVALVQFFFAIVLGFMRTLREMLTIDFSQTPIHFPSKTMDGVQAVLDLVDPMGVLDIVPLILIAVTWGYFIKKIIGLLGGEIKADA
jgi:hypothetical protein